MIPQDIVKQGFLWGLAAVYLFAFTSLYLQIPGLYGDNGLLPASNVLHDLSTCRDKHSSCLKWASRGECQRNAKWMAVHCMKACHNCQALDTSLTGLLKQTPTLLWLTPSLGLDTSAGMEFLCLTGIMLSMVLLVSQRSRDCLSFLVLWFLYFSLFQVGQIFLWYQWDGLLLETGFLAVVIAPWNIKLSPWRWKLYKCKRIRNVSREHDMVTLWLVKWLLFRLMFASGVVKLSFMDPTWWNMTAMYWHYESQCIPTPMAWYFQKLPKWFHRLSVVITYNIEIGLPFLFFAPIRALRFFAYFGQVLLQLLILVTGNYNFFNLLTIVLCVSLLDDKAIMSRNTCCSPCKKSKKQKNVNADIEEQHSDGSEGKADDIYAKTEKKETPSREEPFPSTFGKLLDRMVSMATDRYYGNQLAKFRDLLGSRKARIARTFAIIITCASVFGGICFLVSRWFYFEIQDGTLMSWIAFSPADFRKAVTKATTASIWIGGLSLLIEIAGAFTRILLQPKSVKIYKICRLLQCTFFSLLSLWLFAISLVPLTDVSYEAKESLPLVVGKWYQDTKYLEIAHPYGLFRSMTGVGGRPEIIILGSNTTNGTWKEYNFRYKPGNIYQPPPFVAPHQPRLDWQMWFAALESYSSNPWFLNLISKLLRSEKDVLALMGDNEGFAGSPPKYIRTQVFRYHFTENSTSLGDILFKSGAKSKSWWTREYVREYTPFIVSNDSVTLLQQILRESGIYKRDGTKQVSSGFVYSIIKSLRHGCENKAPQNVINVLFFLVVILLVFKMWWRKMGKRFCTPKLITVRDKCEPSIQHARDHISNCTTKFARKCTALANKSPIGQCYRSRCITIFIEKMCAFYRGICVFLSHYYNKGMGLCSRAKMKLEAVKPSLKKKE